MALDWSALLASASERSELASTEATVESRTMTSGLSRLPCKNVIPRWRRVLVYPI